MIETQKAIDDYLRRLAMSGRSPMTLRTYRYALERLARQAPTLPCTDDDVLAAMAENNPHMNTRVQYHRTIGRFLRHVGARDHDVIDVTQDVPRPRHKRTRPRVLTQSELDRLIEVAAAAPNRDRLIIAMFLDGGIRLGEMASIRAGSIQGRWLRIVGKTGERWVPITPDLAEQLLELADADGVIWHSSRGGALTETGIDFVVRGLFHKIGIHPPRAGCHLLRHTYGTTFVTSAHGAEPVRRGLQDILGHKNPAQTAEYVTIAGDDLFRLHQEHSPAVLLGLTKRPEIQNG